MPQLTEIEKKVLAAARRIYGGKDVEFDAAIFSRSEDGCWVMALVWVPADEYTEVEE